MRMIDADELEARLRMQPNNLSKISVIDMVHASPTIEERKTGRWIGIAEYCKNNNLIPIGTEIFWWCSECNRPIANDYHRTAKFCPRCGAKMEGADE